MNRETTFDSGFAGHFISAPWRSSGKSMLSIGLARAGTRRSMAVQTFKKGPDFIDPLWLQAASLRPCYNLDPYLQSAAELSQTFHRHAAEVVLVEGTMGLHDGLAVDGSDSNAAIARHVNLPVLLVIDCRGMHRTIASLINGIVGFDHTITFSGLILNRIRSARHQTKIEQALREYCDINVLGVVPEHPDLQLDERELGLIPAPEHPVANEYIDLVANTLESSCDLHSVFKRNTLSERHAVFEPNKDVAINTLTSLTPSNTPSGSTCPISIGIAQDEAFHFYYADDLDTLRARGVRLVAFSPMRDGFPADVEGVLIGGGFPERHACALASNELCRKGLAKAIKSGMPVRAECGGLMYLCDSILVGNETWPMVGAIKGAVTMHTAPRGRGYMQLVNNTAEQADNLNAGDTLPAHEFHHSDIRFDSEPKFAYQVKRGHGINGKHDGVCVDNVVASYAHFRHTEATPWIDWFLDSIRQSKQTAPKLINHV